MNGINTHCRGCGFDVSEYSAVVELNNQYRVIYCPVCGASIFELKELDGEGIFYDEEIGQYIKWVSPQPAVAAQNVETLVINKVTINIRVKPLDYSKVFYDHVLVFLKEDGKASLSGELADGQCFAPPDNCRRYGITNVSAEMQANGNYVDVRFQLRGGFNGHLTTVAAFTKPLPDGTGGLKNGSALRVWPDFKRTMWTDIAGKQHAGWSDYFVCFASSDGSIRTEFIRITGGDAREVQLPGITPKGEIDFPPDYIEICASVTKDANGIFTKYWACFRIELQELDKPGQNEPLRLAVDFGTSNTCFSYSIPTKFRGGFRSWSAPGDLKLSDKTKTLVAGLDLESGLENTWLPELRDQELLPSELIFGKKPLEAFSAAEGLLPIRDYTIPPLKWRDGEEKYISSGFKWQHTTEPPSLNGRYQELQKMYLGLALRLAVAELVASKELLSSHKVDPSRVDLYITYPLSMTPEEREGLRESYEGAAKLVAERTGVTLAMAAEVDESQAGEQGETVAEGTQRIFMDVGGGTADISVVEIEESGLRRTEVVDSVRYAGNDFLVALANEDEVGTNEQTTKKLPGGKISSRRLTELERRIRSDGEKLLDDITTFNNSENRRDEAIEALERFLRGLTHYLARAVALRVKRLEERASIEKLEIYLLGNGWRFALALPRRRGKGRSESKEQIEDAIRDRLKNELDILRTAGVLVADPVFEIHHSTASKRVVARGALKVAKKRGVREKSGEFPSFLGSDVVVVLPGKRKSYAWDQKVPLEIEGDLPVDGISISTSLGGFEESKVPDFGNPGFPLVELCELNIRDYLHEDGCIFRSAFNVYLELWHKRHLLPNPTQGWF